MWKGFLPTLKSRCNRFGATFMRCWMVTYQTGAKRGNLWGQSSRPTSEIKLEWRSFIYVWSAAALLQVHKHKSNWPKSWVFSIAPMAAVRSYNGFEKGQSGAPERGFLCFIYNQFNKKNPIFLFSFSSRCSMKWKWLILLQHIENSKRATTGDWDYIHTF